MRCPSVWARNLGRMPRRGTGWTADPRGGREAAPAGDWRDGCWDGAERPPGVSRPHGGKTLRADRTSPADLRQPFRVHAIHGGCGGFLCLPAHTGIDLDPHRERFAAVGIRSRHRPGRDPLPRAAARLEHHARQGQPCHGGDARYGHVPCGGLRYNGRVQLPRQDSWN